MSNTKSRHEEIYTAACSALEQVGGVVKVDQTPESERYTVLRQMADAVVSQTGCTPEAARRNVAKAMRSSRYGVMQERWGGSRPGPHPGRPPKKSPSKV